MTTSTIAVQSVTATSDTQAMRRLRRYLRMRWSLYRCLAFVHADLRDFRAPGNSSARDSMFRIAWSMN
jgi:hypothetical protein